VDEGQALIFKDDYGRMELGINQGSLAQKYGLKVDERIRLVQK